MVNPITHQEDTPLLGETRFGAKKPSGFLAFAFSWMRCGKGKPLEGRASCLTHKEPDARAGGEEKKIAPAVALPPQFSAEAPQTAEPEPDPEYLLTWAVARRNVNYAASVFRAGRISTNIQQICLEKVASLGYIDVFMACKIDPAAFAQIYFKEIDPHSPEFGRKIDKLYRLNPFEEADLVVSAFYGRRADLQKICKKAKEESLAWLPLISLYTDPKYLQTVRSIYKPNEPKDADTVEVDKRYALRCLSQVQKLHQKLQSGELERPSKFSLPASSSGSCRFAAFVEEVAQFRGNEDPAAKVTLRRTNDHYLTAIEQRYSWGKKVMELCGRKKESYLTYKDRKVSAIVSAEEHPNVWHHGLAPLEHTWQDLEDTFENLWKMKVDPHSPASLVLFHQEAIKLIWLIGNTTPVNRGSGTVAEWAWALVHIHHGLRVPVLKKEYPQLDVLDITLPLDYFQNNWRQFFEPATTAYSIGHS